MAHRPRAQEDAKKVLNKQGVVIPLLSAQRHVCPENPTEEQAAICHAYDYKVRVRRCGPSRLLYTAIRKDRLRAARAEVGRVVWDAARRGCVPAALLLTVACCGR